MCVQSVPGWILGVGPSGLCGKLGVCPGSPGGSLGPGSWRTSQLPERGLCLWTKRTETPCILPSSIVVSIGFCGPSQEYFIRIMKSSSVVS